MIRVTRAGRLLDESSQIIAAGLSLPLPRAAVRRQRNDNVTRGPGRTALQHDAVTIAADGSVTVDGSQTLDASARTTVG